MKSFIRKLFKGKQKANATNEKPITKEVIEQMMEEAGINLKVERFKTEALHISTLMMQQDITVAQALDTVQDQALRDELRPFVYAIYLSSAVLALQHLGGLSQERGDDLRTYLATHWPV
jgi:hypothetical protein